MKYIYFAKQVLYEINCVHRFTLMGKICWALLVIKL